MPPTKPLLRYAALFFLCCFVFTMGATSCYYKHFPYTLLRESIEAAQALSASRRMVEKAKLERVSYDHVSTKINFKLNQSYNGYTLFTYSGDSAALLLDENGNQIYHWKQPDDSYRDWSDAHVFPNGDLLFNSLTPGTTPSGTALVKIDKNSKVLWTYDKHVHHKVNMTADGDIVGIRHTMADKKRYPDIHFDEKYFLEDSIFILDSNGNEKRTLSVVDALYNSPYRYLISTSTGHNTVIWDLLHVNSAMMLEPEMAKHFPMFKAGQILISMRSIDAVAVIDLDLKQFVWVGKGDWLGQHDASFQPDGSIMFFANYQEDSSESRIVKFFPENNTLNVIYNGTRIHPFSNKIRGDVSALPNGHYSISYSLAGKILEVNENDKLVSELAVFNKDTGKMIVIISSYRYDKNYFDFLPPLPAPAPVQAAGAVQP